MINYHKRQCIYGRLDQANLTIKENSCLIHDQLLKSPRHIWYQQQDPLRHCPHGYWWLKVSTTATSHPTSPFPQARPNARHLTLQVYWHMIFTFVVSTTTSRHHTSVSQAKRHDAHTLTHLLVYMTQPNTLLYWQSCIINANHNSNINLVSNLLLDEFIVNTTAQNIKINW